MKKKHQYSFAVGSKHGPRSACWTVVVEGGKDVYVTAGGAHRGRFHVSLHRSGQWHIKHRIKGWDKFAVESHLDRLADQQYKVGVFIGIPDRCLRPASDVDRASVPDIWLDRPSPGGAMEIAIMEWDLSDWMPGQPEWPGQTHGTRLIAAYKNGPTTSILILARALPAEDPSVVQMEAMRPKLKPIVLDSPERRAMLFGTTPQGSLRVYKYAID